MGSPTAAGPRSLHREVAERYMKEINGKKFDFSDQQHIQLSAEVENIIEAFLQTGVY